ncbi:MAG: hypothetical protein WCA82_08180 [Jiangellales bacterium]
MPNDALPEVAGFVVTGSVQRPDCSDYLSAVDVASREHVLLRVLPYLDDAERSAVAASLEPFAALTAEHLDGPARLASEADALVVPTRTWRLDTLPAQPHLPGQVVTVMAPVAQAVAALHAAGLAHGNVRAESVSVDDEGRPRLAEAGVAAALHALAPREVPAPTESADRDALLALLVAAARPVDDAALDALVDELVEGEADPSSVADRLLSEVTPVALGDQTPVDAPPAEPVPAGRRRWPWLVLAVVLAGVAAGVAALLATSGDSPDGTATSSPSERPVPTRTSAVLMPEPTSQASGSPGAPAASPDAESAGTLLCGAPGPAPESTPPLAQDWAEVVRALYVRRTAALVTGQTSLLCDVYDPRSPGLASDLELDAAYVAQGVRPDALVFVVEDATLVSEDGALLTLEITDRLEPYRLVDEDGRTVAELPGVPSESWQARLVPDATGSEWVFG